MDVNRWAWRHVFRHSPGTRTVLRVGPSILAGAIVFLIVVGIPLVLGIAS